MSHQRNQWKVLGAVVAIAALAAASAAQPRATTRPAGGPRTRPAVKQVHTYKTVGKVKIRADVYPSGRVSPRPVVVALHGGALILGHRGQVPGDVRRMCREKGYVFVSLDYRLAPEVKVPEIIADLKDGIAWVRREGPKRFGVDPDRLAVVGGSAGGYLTLMSGICVKPPPRALVAYCGYGDVDGDWYARPSAHYRTKPLVTRQQALEGVFKGALTGVDWRSPLRKARGRYYLYLRQNGLWTKDVTGFDPATQRNRLDPYCPVRNVTPEYPPTVLMHGTADTDVPYDRSVLMSKALKRHGVRHELLTIPGAGHGFRGGDKRLITKARARALDFLVRHLELRQPAGAPPRASDVRDRGSWRPSP